MPVKSAKQYGAMAAAAAGRSTIGIPQQVGKKFLKETPAEKRKRLAKALAKKRKKAQKPNEHMMAFAGRY